MNKQQTKETRMFNATDECMNQNQIKWMNILAISLIKDKLTQNIEVIKGLDQKKSATPSNPVTTNKVKLKELLEVKIEVLQGIVRSFAYANGMSELVKKVELLSKGFSKKRETDIEPNVKTFLELVRELQPQLAGYELTEEMIVDVETTRDQFVALVGAPRTTIVQSSSANSQMEKLVKETKDLLTQQLDNLMLRFKTSDPAFYNSYIQSRIVVEPATQHREKKIETAPVA
jgi:DNA-binding phage protein